VRPALRGSLIASPMLDSRAWSGATLGSSEPEVAPFDPFAGAGRRCRDCWFGMNKGGGPMVPPRPKMRTYQRPFFMDLVGVTCSGRLRR
jgi:hypothetical protein